MCLSQSKPSTGFTSWLKVLFFLPSPPSLLFSTYISILFSPLSRVQGHPVWVGKQLRNSLGTGKFSEGIMGKDKGEAGIIKRVIRSQNRVIVEGKNLVKQHIKQGQGHEGGIFTVEAPLHASNVQVLDPVTGYAHVQKLNGASRGIGVSGSIIPCPEILKMRTTPRPIVQLEARFKGRGNYLLHAKLVWIYGVKFGKPIYSMDLVLEKTYNAKAGRGMPEL
ncbi:50S ribosomal protein L24 [Spatholobus suberectus]|nr:50S ribosomal protein L24 [Spatholobus suberectus]